ncbi:hypothetical protein Fmac_017800 [Flemingia macrophylla]|uniref:RING-type domain-containing protein n=1 Tax=Flemingia macrophylla TaxID=520843 RepID=A0ABD1M361_9FABA
MSNLSPSISTLPPLSLTTNNELDTFTKMFLLLIFLSMLLRVCYVFVSMSRERNRSLNNTDNGDGDAQNNTTGLPIDVINSYHTFPYSKTNNVATVYEHDTTCSICISEYEEAEILRMMPQCRHYFHKDCVDVWLKVHASCPVCRNSLLHEPANNHVENV